MGVVRRKQRSSVRQGGGSPLTEGTLRRLSDEGISETPVPARVLETPGGHRWLVILIARLASVDPVGETRGARLIVRAEPLYGGQDRARIVTVRAASLDDMTGPVLRDALLRGRPGEAQRRRRRG
ncbi:MAG TPA: hypothetical protein VFH14_06905 [Gemmatimonadaceae bacterium]|jgi:hypothetical protein|nr:hypothetical protein [Gemmatimonadaceae bacterium]